MYPTRLLYLRAVLHRISRMYCTNRGKDSNCTEIPPEPTNCCMSGCANCVWIEYAEALSKQLKGGGEQARKLILDKIQDTNMRAYLSMELKALDSIKENATNTHDISNTKDPPV